MHISLTPELENAVKTKVASGVDVQRHTPPDHPTIPAFLQRFESFSRPSI